MVYANLGIAQMAIGKFDFGIAHLLTADEEDLPFVQDSHGILNTHLWEQFERPRIFSYLIDFSKNPDADLDFTVDEAFLSELFRQMDQQDRMFLEGTIWALRDNLGLNYVSPNVYTRGRLYSGLKDICLLTETLLRKKQKAASYITLGGRGKTPGLVTNALKGKEIDYPQDGLNPVANNIKEFLNNLEQILNDATSAEVRRIYCLLLARNFTGHHFDLSGTATSPNGRTFFDIYETVLTNILSAVLYFKHINAI
jgi:hypothetical protein